MLVAGLVAVWIVLAALGSSYDQPLRSVGSVGKVAVPALLVAVELSRAWSRGRAYPAELAPGLIHGVLAALLAFALCSVLWSVAPHHTLDYLAGLGLSFAAALLGPWRIARTPAGARLLASGLVLGSTAVLVGNLVAVAVAPHLAYARPYASSPARFRGFLENPDEVGSYAMAAPLALWWAWRRLAARVGTRRLRDVLAAAVPLLFAGEILVSADRSGIVLLAVALTIFLAAHFGGRRGALGGALLVLACGLVAVAALSSSGVKRLVPSIVRPGSLSTLGGRTEAWSAGLQLIGGRPLGGYGLGAEEQLMTLYRSDGARLLDECEISETGSAVGPPCSRLVPPGRLLTDFSGDNAHDSYIGLAVQLGAIALAAALAGLLTVVGRVGAAVRPGDSFAPALLAALVAGLGWGVVETYMFSPGNLTQGLFWVLVALAGATSATAGLRAPASGTGSSGAEPR